MDKIIVILAILSGLSFGIWPPTLLKSGLSGNAGSFVWALTIAICLVPFTFSQAGSFSGSNVKWVFAIGAGMIGAVGVTSLNGAIGRTDFSPQAIATVLLLMVGAQTAVSAAYGIIMGSEKIDLIKLCGFFLVSIGAILLTLKGK